MRAREEVGVLPYLPLQIGIQLILLLLVPTALRVLVVVIHLLMVHKGCMMVVHALRLVKGLPETSANEILRPLQR